MKLTATALTAALLLCYFPLQAREKPDHGPIARFFYAPYGINVRTLTSQKPQSSNNGYSISAGYYYSYFQGEVDISNYTMNKTDGIREIFRVDNPEKISTYDIKAGPRFSRAGDTSFHWIYLGGRRMNLEADYGFTKSDGWGLFLGYTGFLSLGLYQSLEFVFTYDIYYGTYISGDINSMKIHIPKAKLFSDITGVSAGIGLQYEPYGVSILFKMSYQQNSIVYNDKSGTGAFIAASNISDPNILTYIVLLSDEAVAFHRIQLGFEISVMVSFNKYNTKRKKRKEDR